MKIFDYFKRKKVVKPMKQYDKYYAKQEFIQTTNFPDIPLVKKVQYLEFELYKDKDGKNFIQNERDITETEYNEAISRHTEQTNNTRSTETTN